MHDERARTPRLVVIDAASGAGKSSFLRAGLWPRLKRDPDFAPLAVLRPAQGILTGPDGLGRRIAPFFERHGKAKAPGSIHAAIATADAAAGVRALAGLITEATELATAARRAASPEARPPAPLLAIDQGEELFSAENDAESRQFLSLLASVFKASQEGIDPYLLVTIRADSVQSLLTRVAELGLETPKALYLPPLSPASYRDVILKPAEIYSDRVRRLAIEPVLANTLVDDAAGADALPLLAFTLSQLFANYAPEGQLTLARYREMGGASGSIGRALQDALTRAGTAGTLSNLRRLIVPRLATWDPEADQGRGAAKRVVAKIDSVIGGDRAPLEPLANALVAARLLTRSRDTLEVAHEALLRQPPISDWLEENREFLVWRDRLARERASYEGNQRGLLAGRELQIARDWLRVREPDDIAAADTKFISDSAAEDDKRRTEEEEQERRRQTAELEASKAREQAAKDMAAASKRVARRTMAGLAAALLLAFVAGVAGFRAEQASKAADAARSEVQINQSRFLSDKAREQGDTATGILLALEALPDARGDDELVRTRKYWLPAEVSLEAARRMLRELLVLKGHTGAVYGVAVTPDGARIVTGSGDSTARIWDVKTGAELAQLKGHTGTIYDVAVTPDGARIVTGSWDNTARIWDTRTGAEIAQLKGHSGSVYGVAVTPDGARIVTGSGDNTARIWDVKTGAELAQLKGHTGTIYDVAVTPDGACIVTGSADRTARIWDTKTGAELAQLKGHTNELNSVAVTPDGAHIVTGSADRTARIWDAKTGAELAQLKGHTNELDSVAVTPDGARVVTGSGDSTARIWDVKTGAELAQLKGHTGTIYDVAVTPDGARIVTGSADRTARIWDAKTGAELVQLKGHTNEVRSVAVTPDGARIVTGSADRTARIWDAKTGAELAQLKGHTGTVMGVAVTPDGTRIVTGSTDDTARIWDARTGAELAQLKGHTGTIYGVAVTPDGAHIVTGSADSTARIWDVKTGAELAQLKGHTHEVNSVAVTPDGARIVTGSDDDTARIWDAKTGAEQAQLKGHTDSVHGVAVTPDGARIVTGSTDKTARIWDLFPAGQALVEQAKSAAPRCLTPTERKRYYLAATPPRWCSTMQKWPYDAVGSFIESARLLDKGEDEEAKVILDAGMAHDASAGKRIDEAWASAYLSRGRKLLDEGKDEEAKAQFALALQRVSDAGKRIDEAWASAYLSRGQQLLEDGKDEEAKSQFALALARDPTTAKPIDEAWASAYLSRGKKLLGEGKDEEAKAQFALALARDPSNRMKAKVHDSIAWRWFLRDKPANGLADAEQAVALAPDDNSILDTRGQIYLALGRIDAAFVDLDKAISRGFSYPGTLYGRGRCHETKGNTKLAVADYLRALEQNADDDYGKLVHTKARERLAALGATSPSEPTK